MPGAGETLSLDQLADWLDGAAQAIAHPDLAPVLQECADLEADRVRENITGAHSPSGEPWEPLKEATVKRKHGDSQPLAGFADCVEMAVTPTGFQVWVESPHAEYHQNGTRTIPARPMVGLTEPNADEYAGKIADAVVKLMDR